MILLLEGDGGPPVAQKVEIMLKVPYQEKMVRINCDYYLHHHENRPSSFYQSHKTRTFRLIF